MPTLSVIEGYLSSVARNFLLQSRITAMELHDQAVLGRHGPSRSCNVKGAMPRSFTSTTTNAFGSAMRAARIKRGWTLQQLSDAMHEAGRRASTAKLSNWELGKNLPPGLSDVEHLDRVLGADDEVLAGWRHALTGDGGSSSAPIEMSASGIDLDELRAADPDAYAAIETLARAALDRANQRRAGA